MKYILRLIHLSFGGVFWLLCMIVSFIWHLKWDINNYPFPFGYLCPFVDGDICKDDKYKLNYVSPFKYLLK